MHVVIAIEGRAPVAHVAGHGGERPYLGRCPACGAYLALVAWDTRMRETDACCEECGAIVGRVFSSARVAGDAVVPVRMRRKGAR